jgi:hypothetical protein
MEGGSKEPRADMDNLRRIDELLARIEATARDVRGSRGNRHGRFEFRLIASDSAEARALLAEMMARPSTEANLRLLAADSIEAEVKAECGEARGSALVCETIETLQAKGAYVMGIADDWSLPFMVEKCR